ncbi:MAG TPA: anaerobic sulfatase-maturation protein [Bacteroidales bacterium]|nr:anaerobic sulfatase-maturation protein [Bacteroidales bacterium]
MLKPAGPACNLNCDYCYYLEKQKLYRHHQSFIMKDDILENFIRQFIDAHEVPVVSFTWQGGEPTLAGLDFYRRAIDYQKKYANGKKIENTFQTNGTKIDEEWCDFFVDNDILAGISVDGPEYLHDHYRKTPSGGPTFARVMKSIDLMNKKKVRFNTLTVVSDYNVHYPLEIYRFLKGTGSRHIHFLPVVERISDTSEKDELQLVDPSCSNARLSPWTVPAREYGEFLTSVFDEWVRRDVGRVFIQIFDATLANHAGYNPGVCIFNSTCGGALVMEHNGDLFSCDHFVYPAYFLGNINDTALTEMVGSQRQFDFGISKRNSLPMYCRRCEYLYVCHGECPKHRFLVTPDGEPGLNYLCEGYRLFFAHSEQYFNFMAKELKGRRAPANVMQWIKNKEGQAKKIQMPERNDPCPCGSGRKFKNCCATKPPWSNMSSE